MPVGKPPLATDRNGSRDSVTGEDLDAINTKGHVPILKLDNGEILTENIAVLCYIADLNPAAELAPAAGTLGRYRLLELLAYINSETHKNFAPLLNTSSSEDMKNIARTTWAWTDWKTP